MRTRLTQVPALVLGVAVLLSLPHARAGEDGDAAAAARAKERAALVATARQMLATVDSYVAIEFLTKGRAPLEAAGLCVAVSGDLYWNAKDLQGALTVGRAGIQHCLTTSNAIAASDAETARKLRVTAQRLSFDLASFAWPGWDEKGIEIRAAELAIGLDAARLDLRLVREMGYPPEKHANAHWIVGAQLLSAGRLDAAYAEFVASRAKAQEAKDAEKEWMAHGYAGIAAALAAPKDPAGRAALNEAIGKLEDLGTEGATFLATQLGDVFRTLSSD